MAKVQYLLLAILYLQYLWGFIPYDFIIGDLFLQYLWDGNVLL